MRMMIYLLHWISINSKTNVRIFVWFSPVDEMIRKESLMYIKVLGKKILRQKNVALKPMRSKVGSLVLFKKIKEKSFRISHLENDTSLHFQIRGHKEECN